MANPSTVPGALAPWLNTMRIVPAAKIA